MERSTHSLPLLATVPHGGRCVTLYLPDGTCVRLTEPAARRSLENLRDALGHIAPASGECVAVLQCPSRRWLARHAQRVRLDLGHRPQRLKGLLLLALLILPIVWALVGATLVALLAAGVGWNVLPAALLCVPGAAFLAIVIAWRLMRSGTGGRPIGRNGGLHVI